MTKLADERTTATNTGLAKVAVQCSADPEVSGWLIKIGSPHQSRKHSGW
jgi:hypothetical protein